MKRPLIADRLCRQTTSERSPSQTEGESTPFQLAKSGLTDEYNFDCAELSASTNDSIGVTHTPAFQFSPFGLGLAEFINLGCDFNAALTTSAPVTTGTNKNENKMKYECRQEGPHSHTQTQQPHLTAPAIDSSDKIDLTAAALQEISNVECAMGIWCENQVYCRVNDIFDDYFSENFYDNHFASPGMLFWIFFIFLLFVQPLKNDLFVFAVFDW